ncbi:4Fe-4S binding protein [Opacimonas viscosa]|uniref:4Fe-4S binding protein n=1 Tax=Opacimonas viscosa TaxID=2961944 RepID=UPI002546537C|nr:4Fe-4S binding protein [Opacimonas viscosa]
MNIHKCSVWLCLFFCISLSHLSFGKEGDVTDIPTAIDEIFPTATRIGAPDPDIPVTPVYQLNQLLGYVFESQDFAPFMGFTGEPINILIGLDPDGNLLGLRLIKHNEPIFVHGLGPEPLLEFITQYTGHSIRERFMIDAKDKSVPDNTYFDGVTKATVSVLVVNDTIITAALKVAMAKLDGFVAPSNMLIDPDVFVPLSFTELVEQGYIKKWIVHRNDLVNLPSEVRAAINDVPLAFEHFIELYFAFLDIPIVARNLLSESERTRLLENLKPGEQPLLVMSRGDYSFIGDDFIAQTVPARLNLSQNTFPVALKDIDFYSFYEPEFITEVPSYNDVKVLRLKSQTGFELNRTIDLGLGINYQASFFDTQQHVFTTTLDLPTNLFKLNPAAKSATPIPLWQRIWSERVGVIVITCLYLILLTGVFIKQQSLVKHTRLTHQVRAVSLFFVLFFIGFYAQGQLSVVNIYTLLLAVLNGFKIQVFLLDPVIFILWVFVFISLFIVGRGLFCGWLCPFGALQEILGWVAKRCRIKQIKLNSQQHRWGQSLKYFILLGLLASAFFSVDIAEKLAEVEPFKTSITLYFVRTWPFVLYAVLLLLLSLKIHKVYCRYLCPLGAGLAIVGRYPLLKLLRRRSECGTPCQLCKTKKCDIDAINKDGSIDYAECIQCLECVVTIENPNICVIDKYKNKSIKVKNVGH